MWNNFKGYIMQRKSRKCCHSLTLTKQYNKTPSFDQFEGKKFEVNVIFDVRIIPNNKAIFFLFNQSSKSLLQ